MDSNQVTRLQAQAVKKRFEEMRDNLYQLLKRMRNRGFPKPRHTERLIHATNTERDADLWIRRRLAVTAELSSPPFLFLRESTKYRICQCG